ncbi:VaFE repeat-containing surface-anchored protein [Coprococcus comes]|uniref:VaFE repeat-containing surface-anchored protein n=1 Tax=Coprococcus comes TaxID=410072 RepID=UPI00156EA522|nr:VaFE repeat-containing surface-anchored protein [Coprococcus comes]NSC15249.1 VaFE repeat-containing surface-anchored protein [Coprococcus comes]NSC18408.1 VaFE repeat-containing surface-anchored protein [Coprococcus comes]NSC68297.1 VaFE repeat-containing surface-anchored protein [Coprococcus comes]NSC86692.1 VaFE repeat-containing surface-anchored protein [Coprococcus comes]NSC93533.1 VaFE repeat-containing surface-anchored protein [Coprococcus comes]
MKILGRIKKSKVLTAVMTAVLIFQSACPTGLAYAAQKSGVSAYAAGQTIDQALGATKTVESVLSQHENDEYYLTTPYGNKGPHGEGGAIDTWDCWKPKGEYGSGAYMNCAGFVVAVLRACGANTSIIGNYTAQDGYNRGNETNASKWDEYCRDNNAVSYTFSSKEQMLASGILEKGDIIYMEPADWNHSNSDCHIGFFWGSNSSEDLFWHSSSHADGIVKGYFPNSAGGNVISKITPKYPVRYYRVIKTLHKGYLTLHKDSSNKTLTDSNDCYSLAGAEYGVYTDSNCSNKVATLTTNVNGNANTVSLNPGRYYVKETKAPKGYFTDSQVYTADVSGANRESSPVKLSVSDNPANDPMAMLLGKYDGQKTYNGAGNLPQGSATLAGAEFTVDYYATLDYKSYDDLKNADVKPTRSWTFKTNENGIANFKADDFVSGDAFYYNSNNDPCIPRGTVVIRETKAPTGYVKSDDVSFQKIQENPTTGAVRTYNVPEVAEQVYRSDIEFTKKADNGSEHLAGVPFKVTSLTTGESHIAVTDENGYFSSASSWNAHDSNTNANDWALTASDTIDSTKLDANAGFWFGNNSVLDGNGTTSISDAVKADNKLGALPFDTYSIEELRCSANEGYALINTTVTVTRDAKTIDLGTFDDPEPEIHTTAYDASDSDHYVGVGTVKISDKVEYSHLVAGKTYTVIGELHDAATGDAVTVNGQAITAEKTFTAEDSAGSVTLDYAFDSYDLKGKTLVVYETLTDAKGAKLAEHRDKSDVSQQVTVLTPKLSTSAVGDADNSKSVTAEGDVTVTDYVRYTGLTAGQTYTLTGTLMDKSTKKAFVDADGNPVTATAEFTAEAESGTATVTFTFNASSIKTGTKLIAFETLSTNGIEIADHKDINDIDQTVTVKAPVIGTTAVDAADGDKTVTGEENVAVRDTVHYNNVTPGKTYKVIGTLYEKVLDKNGKVTKKVFKDKDGTPVTAEANFTAEDSYGNVDVTFYFDGSSLKEGTSLVAFESLSYNDNEIASHADVNDSGQTVIITKPKLSTTATDALDGDKNLIGEDNATIVDTVHYMNVTPGKTYKVTGTLYEKVTDKDGKVTKKQLLDADGNPVTAETEFIPEDTYGTVDVTFAFDASDLKAKDKVVAFESLSLNGKELASHADIEDKSQTVTITKPEVGTTAKDGFDGNQTVVSDTEVSVVDTVKYKNVTPGKTYKVSGTLYEKVTDKDGKVTKKQLLDADGNPVTAETEFVPEDTYGTVDVTFTFDGSLLKDNTPVVAFESLSYKDKEIASHSDIEDEDQTVTMHTSEIGTTATDKLDGDKTVIADAESTVTDKVEYDHVLTGKAYTMAGILMDAKTGLPVLTGEGAKKYTEDDLTKFTSGLMNVLGFQSNTYSIKVKDKDWGNGAAIVKNADGSYTYDASERTENEDGTWTVKTDTQTLTEQEDGTWKLTGLEGSGSATADGGTSSVRNIEETYKADEVEVTDNGIDWSNAKKLPTASIDLAKVKAYAEENKDLLSCLVYKTAEFTPEKESGSIDMDYTFNSNDVIDRLSGETKNLVVFEVMFKGSIENASDETPVSIVASECDKDNEGQTVKLAPSTIGTTATDKSDGDHELMAGKDAVITDEVKYEGLIPGKEYTLHATLMDKKTGEPLKVADKGVTAELKFTPNSESGTVSINLGEFDATSLDGHTLVVFEELTKQSDIDGKATDVTVAEHKDINDEGQSVTVTSTPAGSTYGKTGVDMTNIAIAIGILLIAAGCATAYGIKSRKTAKGDADESAEDNTEA